MSNFRKNFFNKNKSKIIPEQYQSYLIENNAENSNYAMENGYYGWKVFFQQEFTAAQKAHLLKRIDLFKNYIKATFDSLKFNEVMETLSFTVSYKLLKNSEELSSSWPNFDEEFTTNCEQLLSCLGLAMHQARIDDLISSTNGNYKYNGEIPFINVHVTDYGPIVNIRELKLDDYSKLVSVYGTVIRTGYRSGLKCIRMAFKCSQCGTMQVVKQINYEYTLPQKCLSTGCKKTTEFIPMLDSCYTKSIEHQTVKIQEVLMDQTEIAMNRGMPLNLECNLTNDLVNSCAPGDDIIATGILKVNDSNSQDSGTFSMYLDCISLINRHEKIESMVSLTMTDYYDIKHIFEQPNVFRLLIHSICPYIYGHELVKAGLLLTLFSGNRNNNTKGFKRTNSHILLIGDPGLGKSEMLKACTSGAPRGIYVCGVSSTNTGLTASITRDSNGDYGLEAGALLLSDNGVCCIDEFDKMTHIQQHALLEVMEQQNISLAKAGIVCSLPAQCRIIAAANPFRGHYDHTKSLLENLNLTQKILTRFDLIFLLLDSPNEQQDAFLSDHIVALRSRNNSGTSQLKSISKSANIPTMDESWKDSLKRKPEEKLDLIPTELLKKYITYAHKYIHPKLNEEAKVALKEHFMELMAKRNESDSTPITTRLLESLIRLTEARAKLSLREEATEADAKEVIEIFKWSNIVPTNNLPRLKGAAGVGTPKPAKNLRKREIEDFIDLLSQLSSINCTKQFKIDYLKELLDGRCIDSRKMIDLLNQKGFLLMKGNGMYEFTGK